MKISFKALVQLLLRLDDDATVCISKNKTNNDWLVEIDGGNATDGKVFYCLKNNIAYGATFNWSNYLENCTVNIAKVNESDSREITEEEWTEYKRRRGEIDWSEEAYEQDAV